jgi:general secretion pathway protein G
MGPNFMRAVLPIRIKRDGERGLTLVELIVTVTILAILASAALPIARYKDAADKNAFQIKLDSQGYPPDLDKLVTGEEVQGKKLRFLRKIPVDPMTGKPEWGLRSMQDDPKSDSFGGQNVFDVYTKSTGTALDGTKYSDW